jgi:hypothetical protein
MLTPQSLRPVVQDFSQRCPATWRESISCEQNIDGAFKQAGWRFRQGNFCHCVIGATDDVGRMWIRAEPGHVLHANSTLVDRVDLATPLALSSQPLPAPRLLLLRSGLERSDFVPWPLATNPAGFAEVSVRGQSRPDLLAPTIDPICSSRKMAPNLKFRVCKLTDAA